MKARRWAFAVLLVGGAALGSALPAQADAPGGVSFTVTDFRGDPAWQTNIGGSVRPYGGADVFGLATDTAGRAAATGVPPGTYYVTIQPDRFRTDSVGPFSEVITVVSGQTTDIDFHLPASDWASGRVTARVTHKGLGGVMVLARSQCNHEGDLCDGMLGYTDANGYYTIHSLIADPTNWPSTSYTIELYSRDVTSPVAKTYTVATEAGLGHVGLDFKRLTKSSDIPSI